MWLRYAATRRPSLFVLMIALLANAVPHTADARAQPQRWDDVAGGRAPGQLLLAVVAIAQQKITLYDANGPVLRASISSGRDDYETPAGVFSVLQKEAEHYSNRYDDAAMPFMQRITWSGIALHAGPLPGYPASHGCIRLPYKFAEQIFGMTKLGLRVVIARNDVAPTFLSHAVLSNLVPAFPDAPQAAVQQPSSDGVAMKLGMPAAPGDPISRLQDIATQKREAAEAATKKADEASAVARAQAPAGKRAAKLILAAEDAKARAERQLEAAGRDLAQAKSPAHTRTAQRKNSEAAQELIAVTARLQTTRFEMQPKIDAAEEARKAAEATEAAKSAAQEEARAARRKLWPVSIFISLKTGRLYVRQGFEPVMEFPVAIRDPDKPVGTLIFSAADSGDGDVRWNAVSIDATRPSNPEGGKLAKRRRNVEPVSTSRDTAIAALDRITLPQEVTDLISESVWVGTSLILSDEGPHKETGPATDFVVVMSGEPQGGLKMRRVEPVVAAAAVRSYRPIVRQENRSGSVRLSGERSFRNPLGASFLPW